MRIEMVYRGRGGRIRKEESVIDLSVCIDGVDGE
jgi:hypothetical protein